MKRLYFIRHGLSEMNVSRLIAGHTESPLTPLGRKQARQAGESAKDLAIDLMVSSPQSRAVETAKIVAKQIGYSPSKILYNELLKERFYGKHEGAKYKPGIHLESLPASYNIELDDKLVTRAQLALEWLNTLRCTNILVVSHGGFGRALRSVLKADYPMSHPSHINNAEIHCWVEE